MSAIHSAPFEGAGKTYNLNGGGTLRVEDWWDRVYGESWALSPAAAAFKYAMRQMDKNLPMDDKVVYGKDEGGLGHIVHLTELAEVVS